MKKQKLEDIKFEVREGEEGIASVRACAMERCHPDDLEGECDQCHKPIFYRPEPPFLIRKICLECCIPLIEAEEKPVMVVTENTVREVKKLYGVDVSVMQAWTKYPNTPESDREPEVMCVVQLDDGTKVELMATDPSDAIKRVKETFLEMRKGIVNKKD